MSALNPVDASKFISREHFAEKIANLKEIENANGDIKKIRFLLKGNRQAGLELFKEAIAKENAVLQIQLSYALYEMKIAKDLEKDFSSLTANDLESLSYYPRNFVLFNLAYDEATGLKSSRPEKEMRALSTFGAAVNHGYFPAVLELNYNKWAPNIDTYGFAVQLRRYVGQGDKRIDFYFGRALKNGCQIDSPLYYEGIYWMEKSSGNKVKYPREGESFEFFVRSYLSGHAGSGPVHYCDGFCHVDFSTILTPSRDAWEAFIAKKIIPIQPAPLSSYIFSYHAEEIRSLLYQYKIESIEWILETEDPMEKQTVQCEEREVHRSYIHELRFFEDREKIGTISVRSDTFAIYRTFRYPKIQPVLDFVENILTRFGSVNSAQAWLNQIKTNPK